MCGETIPEIVRFVKLRVDKDLIEMKMVKYMVNVAP